MYDRIRKLASEAVTPLMDIIVLQHDCVLSRLANITAVNYTLDTLREVMATAKNWINNKVTMRNIPALVDHFA